MISYTLLRDYIRKEKETNALQKLPETFLDDVSSLLSSLSSEEKRKLVMESFLSLLRLRLFKLLKKALFGLEVSNALPFEEKILQEFESLIKIYLENLETMVTPKETNP